MALLTADSFNRTNSTTSLGSTDGAGSLDPRAWTAQLSTWGINSNQAYVSAVSGGFGLATLNLLTADVDLQVTNINTTGESGILFRYVDTANYWIWDTFAGLVQLYKKISGSLVGVGSTVGGGGAGDVLRVVANGTAISCYRNGTLVTSTTDSLYQSSTLHGLYIVATTNRLDDWSASSLVVTPPAPIPYVPTVTYSLDTPSAAVAAGYMVLE